MKKIFLALLLLCSNAFGQTYYNAIATAYVTTTISQNVVFDSNMQQGGTFTFSVLAHNGGGRAGQSDTANVKIEFYTAGGSLVTSVNSSNSGNLPNPNAVCGNPCIDTTVPWSTLTTTTTLTSAQAATVAYAKVSMYGVDGSFWAGDYGPWYRAPTLQVNGGGNLLYNPEFGPYNNQTAQGWVSNPGFGACQGAWGGSNACIVNSDGVPGASTVGLVANQNGGGPSATGGTTSGTAGGYNNTMSVTNAGTGATSGSAPPPAPTVTGTSVTYTTRSVVTSPGVTSVYRTPVTTTTYSDNTTTSSNGTEALYQTKVATSIVTNKIVGNTLTTYSTPVLKVTPADGNPSTIEGNGVQTVTTQTVQTGLKYEVWRYDSKEYSCGWLGCIWTLGRVTPSTSRGSYGNPVRSGQTSNSMYVQTNANMPNGDSGLGYADNTVIRYTGTITAPTSASHLPGSVYRLYFYNQSDDGFKLDINGVQRINNSETNQWQAIGSGYNSSGYMDVVAGQTYNLEAWYWNVLGGWGLRVLWDYGDGMKPIYNTSLTNGTISNIDVDVTGLAYSNPAVVPTEGTAMPSLCCGGSAQPFDADTSNTSIVANFASRTTNDSKVYIEQIGNMNTIIVDQSGTQNNYTRYVGDGSSNNITITQNGNSSTIANVSDVTVIGNSNSVSITQQSTGGVKGAFVNIQDSNNTLILQQKDSGNHYAEITLSGGNKNVDVLQQGSGGHMAKINLSGIAQDLSLTQSGSTQQFYSITSNCATTGSCAKITVNQGQ